MRGDARIVILSSSLRLREADGHFRDRLGSPEAVISRAALSYLISLLPETGLGPTTLRRALFEFGEAAQFNDPGNFALKIIKSSGTAIIPWAQRSAVRRQIETSLHREAAKADVPFGQMRMRFTAGKDPEAAAEIIANAVSALALKDPERIRLQRDLAETRKRLAEATALAEDEQRPAHVWPTRRG